MRNHVIHCRNLKPPQHSHDVVPSLAFAHALLAGHGPVARQDWQLQAETTRRKTFSRLSWRIWVNLGTLSQTIT